ncbi:MAG: TetR/AcrR family transcriptional regulator [Tabrizicola sp.]|nr:TetR/AcrR family transcriptional regulator [Tabrizicola sp.]
MDQRPYHHGDLRAALLSAAEDELADRGIEGFSLRSVAKRAGVSHAAPAHHFGDVVGLLTALAAEGFHRFQATLDAQEVGASGPRDRAVRAGLGYMRFADERPALFRLIFSSAKPSFADPELVDAAETAYRHLQDLIAALGGGLTDVTALWALSHGLADLSSGQRLRSVAALPAPERETLLRQLFERVLPPAA